MLAICILGLESQCSNSTNQNVSWLEMTKVNLKGGGQDAPNKN